METVLKLKPQPASRPAETQTMTPEEMQQIAGVYNQPNRFNIEIYVKSGKLFIREFEQEMPLTKISENRYSFQFPRAPKPLQIYVQPARDGKAGLVHQYVWAFRKIS